jgi:predicted amidohydrolase
MLTKKFTIAAVQLNSNDDKENNLKNIAEFVEEAVEKKAKVVALPESINYMGTEFECEPIPGYTTNRLSELARKYEIYIHGGTISEDSGTKRPYTTTVMINPYGDIIAKYRLLHMFDVDSDDGYFYKESDLKTPGDQIVSVDTEYGKLGFSISFDIRFPEMFRQMAVGGADIIFAPSDFIVSTGKDHWETILRARAIENTCYIVAPAQTGAKLSYLAYGKSMIVDPWGNVIAKASDKPCVITADIDFDYLEKVRFKLPWQNNRRVDVY